MKVILTNNVLSEYIKGFNRSNRIHQFIHKHSTQTTHTFWLSSISITIETAPQITNGHKNTFTIIPLRQSTLIRAMQKTHGDYEARILMASAEEMQLDIIITADPSRFVDTDILALTPQEFNDKQKEGEWETVDNVPFLDLKVQHALVYNEIDNRMTDIIANTEFILGRHVKEFESGFAKLHGVKHALGVSSGTDALHVALAALKIKPGDRVVLPVNTFIATAEAVSLAGATPVFVDCDTFYNMDVNKLEHLLNHHKEKNNIKAIIPVHLYGQPADMDAITGLANKHNLSIVEDACQAHLAELNGHKVGHFGQFCAFSFYPGKNLGAYGEAGALLTNDATLFERANMIRQHGEVERYHHSLIGHNYRMAAMQGAVLSSKLPHLETWTEKRRTNATLYKELLQGIGDLALPKEMDGTTCVYHLFVIQTKKRDELRAHLQKHNIATGLHYPVPLHLQGAYASLNYKPGDFPQAESAAKRILSLPMYPELTHAQITYVCDKIKTFYR